MRLETIREQVKLIMSIFRILGRKFLYDIQTSLSMISSQLKILAIQCIVCDEVMSETQLVNAFFVVTALLRYLLIDLKCFLMQFQL